MAHGVNDTNVFTVTVGDTNEHDLPDVDGDDGSAQDPFDVRGRDMSLVKVVNDHDQDATVYLEGTTQDDAGFAEPNRYSNDSKTASANGGVVALSTEDNWAFLRVVVVYGTAPSDSTDHVKAVFQTDSRGD